MDMKILLGSSLISVLFVACALLPANGQITRRSSTISADLKRAILAQKSFDESRWYWHDRRKPVYIVDDELTSSQMPRKEGIVFKLLPESEIERMRDEGVNFYRFENFQRLGTRYSVVLSRMYIEKDRIEGESYSYSGRRVGGRWKLRRGMETFFHTLQ